MPVITYSQLTTDLECIQQIKEVEIIQEINEHGVLHLTAILSEQSKDNYVKKNLKDEQITLKTTGTDSKVLFKGMIREIRTETISGLYYLKIEAVSNSFKMDLKKESHSFQDRSMTYKKLLQSIAENYPGGDIIDYASKGNTLDKLILQYQETDWEFLKRLASHYHAGLIPSILHDSPKIMFGFSDGTDRGTIESHEYYITKNVEYFMKYSENSDTDIQEQDAVEFHIDSENNYEIGDHLFYQGISLHIKAKKAEMVHGILTFFYTLSTKKGFSRERLYNRQLAGVSLKGTVIDIIRDKIKVHLAIDQDQKKSTAWEFPYGTLYTARDNIGWYCMPEKGDTVLIHFPTWEEVDAVGSGSVRVKEDDSDDLEDPDVKIFRTRDGKEIRFTPEEILITCVEDEVYLRLNQESGIEIISSGPIRFQSEKGIKLEADETIKLFAKDQVLMKCKTSQIMIDDQIDICGEDVKIN